MSNIEICRWFICDAKWTFDNIFASLTHDVNGCVVTNEIAIIEFSSIRQKKNTHKILVCLTHTKRNTQINLVTKRKETEKEHTF